MSKEKAAEYLIVIEKKLSKMNNGLGIPLETPRISYEYESAKQAFNSGNYTGCIQHCQVAESLINDFTKSEDLINESISESDKIKRE